MTEKQITKPELMAHIRKEIKKYGAQSAFANRLNISEQYLTDVLKERREPGDKILAPLGFKRVVYYEQISDLRCEEKL